MGLGVGSEGLAGRTSSCDELGAIKVGLLCFFFVFVCTVRGWGVKSSVGGEICAEGSVG